MVQEITDRAVLQVMDRGAPMYSWGGGIILVESCLENAMAIRMARIPVGIRLYQNNTAIINWR